MNRKSTTLVKATLSACLIFALNTVGSVAQAQLIPPSPAGASYGGQNELSYADLVNLSDMAPIVVQARITQAIALKPAQAPDVQPGFRRFYLTAHVGTLIRGDGGISPDISYLYDARLDSRGKPPKLKKADVLLYARPGQRPGEVQLVARDSQMSATPQRVAQAKAIISDIVATNAPPKIIGIGDAFHVAGTVAGEGETQIFLRTANGDPVSLSIIRRPGIAPRWAVALGEIVDEAARAPQPGTLLWYRLACALPPQLPSSAVRSLPVLDAEAARADYRIVIDALGPCGKTLTPQ